jgi:hypothetical protein
LALAGGAFFFGAGFRGVAFFRGAFFGATFFFVVVAALALRATTFFDAPLTAAVAFFP